MFETLRAFVFNQIQYVLMEISDCFKAFFNNYYLSEQA